MNSAHLRRNMFYFMINIFSVVNHKVYDSDLEKKYSKNFHIEFIEYFFSYLTEQLDQFIVNNKVTNLQIADEILFCIVVFIDDLFIREKKEIKSYWMEQNLEKRFFNSQSAGDKFYANIEHYFKNDSKDSLLILSAYYLTLKLGFLGALATDRIKLQKITVRLYAILDSDEIDVLPVIKNHYIKKLQRPFTKISKKINGKFTLINITIALLFIFITTVLWEYKTSEILSIFK